MEKMKPISTRINVIRLFADMQVCTTYKSIKQFLRKMRFAKGGGICLDVGCGDQPYRHLFMPPNMDNVEYVPMDWEGAERGFQYSISDIIHYDGVHFPFEDNIYDLVFHTEVTEHVQDVAFFFKECYRVLRQGGELLFSMPFAARYHYIPYDYWRLTPSAIELLLKNAGFENIVILPRSTDITVACYKIVSIGYRLLLSKKIFKVLLAVLLCPLWAVSIFIGQISIWLEIGETDDCLGYTVYAEKIKK